MALSLDSVFRPFNEFFSRKFAGDGARVTFRFASLPRAFVDSDFLTPLHPEWGPSPAVALEMLSIVADGVTRLDPDGRSVWLSTSRLSELYNFEILGPAIPFVPNDITDESEKQARVDAFNAAKADALGLWARIKASSLIEGAGADFRPSTAIPDKWWDRTAAGVWTHQSFEVKGAATSPGQPAPPDLQLRKKIDDSVLRSVLQSQVAAAAAPRLSPATAQSVSLSRPAMVVAQPIFAAALANNDARVASLRTTTAIQREVTLEPSSAALHNELTTKIATLPFREKLEIQAVLATKASTQPVITSDVTIGFDYCVVNITRPWLHDAFINNSSWRIPGQGKGQLSANDGHGLPALPVGFVAVKNLSIQAPWTPADITNLEESVQFGPFNFDSKVVNGAIAHEGIQIIGWMLQDLPDLPPNS
jgi:hypothetical protein